MAKIGPLELRNNFMKWTETVKGTCKPWSDEQFEAAAMTRLIYGNFIRVWREKKAVLRASRMKRLLLTNLSHEVRTPLNAVLNYLEMALEKPLKEDTKALLAQSHAASKSLVYVVDDLLHLTGANKQPPPSTIHIAFDLPKGIQVTLDQLHNHAVRKSLRFDVIKDIDLPRFVAGDLPRLQQSVTTLVTNAIKNTEKGGIIVHLGARSSTDETCVVRIAVEDTGKGMSERELDNLFQDFEQVPDEDSENSPTQGRGVSSMASEKGSMLGLSLALLARYIKNCGGQIRGQSVAGKGSTFSLDIPMRLAAKEAVKSISRSSPDDRSETCGGEPRECPSVGSMKFPTTAAGFQLHLGTAEPRRETKSARAMHYYQESSTDPRQLGGLKIQDTPRKESFTILIAEDNPVNLAILRRRLIKMGHEVRTSANGQHCFEKFQKHHHEVDFVLMDLNMPLVDGIQSTWMIRTMESVTLSSVDQRIHSVESLGPPRTDFGKVTTPRPADESSAGSSTIPQPQPQTPSVMHSFNDTSITSGPQQLLAMNQLMSPPLTNPMLMTVSKDRSGLSASNFPVPPRIEPSTPVSDSTGFQALVTSEEQRQLQQQQTQPVTPLSEQVENIDINQDSASFFALQGRVPIFAVSASLDQHSQESLEAAGFDGWLSKPIDFKKLTTILVGAMDDEARAQMKCKQGDFAGGGWFA